MKLLLILCLSTFYCLSVYALGGWTSGGGYAAKRGNTYYLYDFVEGQLYDNIYFNQQQTDQMQINKRLRSVMMPLGEEVVRLTNKKINEIYIMVPEFAEMLVKTIETYQWRTTEWQILAANDLGNTYGNPTSGNNIEKIPMVFRDDAKKVAWIVKDIWQKLSINQKLGTIFHEAIYAIMAGQLDYHTSEYARELNIYIFDSTFQYQSIEQFMGKLHLLGWNKNWLTYDEYIYFKSNDFAKECKTFNDQVETFISSTVQEYDKIYKKLDALRTTISRSKHFSSFHRTTDIIKASTLYINGVRYYYPSIDGTIIYHVIRYRTCKDTFDLRTMSKSNQKCQDEYKQPFAGKELSSLMNYIDQANQLIFKLNNPQFSEYCQLKNRYQESSLEIINRFATLQILN